MQAFSEFSSHAARQIRVVAADIDDTISTEGKILPEAFNAVWKLYRAGIQMVPITGRCAGWVDHIARFWPVTGVVGENGAMYMYMDEQSTPKRLKKRYYMDPHSVTENATKFERIKKEVFTRFPTCKVASDQPYREFDLAIDFCEDVPRLTPEEVQEIVSIFQKHGANGKVSSIHVNGWFGDFDKLKMFRIFCQEQLGFSVDADRSAVLFIGDSPMINPCLNSFPTRLGCKM